MLFSPFKLERFFSKYEFSAPYILCSSDVEPFLIHELLGLEADSLKAGATGQLPLLKLGYTETQGSKILREEISKLYKDIKPENTLVHSGAEEGIFILMNVFLKEGDHVIVQFPGYQSLCEVAKGIGCEVTKWIVKGGDNWDLDLDFLEMNIKKNTRAIIVNFPHNPTGCIMTKDKFEKVVNITREKNIYLISDDVYRFLEYKDEYRLPSICEVYENGITISSMSKAFALPGLRLGWTVTRNQEVINKMQILKDYTTICISAPSEFLGLVALRNKGKIFKRNLDVILDNLKIFDNFLNKFSNLFSYIPPMGGTMAFPKLKLDLDVEKFCIDLIEKKGVFLLPSTVYDYGNKHFRVGLGRKNVKECLEKFDEFLSENQELLENRLVSTKNY